MVMSKEMGTGLHPAALAEVEEAFFVIGAAKSDTKSLAKPLRTTPSRNPDQPLDGAQILRLAPSMWLGVMRELI